MYTYVFMEDEKSDKANRNIFFHYLSSDCSQLVLTLGHYQEKSFCEKELFKN